MNPPNLFKIKKDHGWSQCNACDRWRQNVHFFHEGTYWTLCLIDFEDYWENTYDLRSDYKFYG